MHAGFVVTGVFTVMLGPVLPLLAQRWSLTDSQTANFFTAQFGGLLLGVAASSYLLHRRYRPAFVSGFLLMGLGAATLGRGPWLFALLSLLAMGFGNGFITAATNLWVGEAVPEGKARALSFVNFSWTFGAVSCPFIFRSFATPKAFLQALGALGVITVIVAIVFAFSRVDSIRDGLHDSGETKTGTEKLFDRTTLIFSLLFFLYVGAETAVGGWVATFSRRVSASAGTAWILTPAFFWAGMLVGRGTGTLALRHAPERRVVQSGSVLGFAGIVFLTQLKTLAWINVAAFSIGLGFSVIFPISFAWMAGHYGLEARRVTGFLLAIAELGAAAIPWLVGVISAVTSSLRIGLGVLAVDLASVLILASIVPLSAAAARKGTVSTLRAEAPQ
jgi:MFS transporter, FHS family, glucose/mannose:H+ symporter